MPHCCRFLSRFVSSAFFGYQMEYFRTFVILYFGQNTNEIIHIVPVNRAKIADIHCLEYVLFLTCKERLQTVIYPYDLFFTLFIHPVSLFKETVGFVPHLIIQTRGRNIYQILGKAS